MSHTPGPWQIHGQVGVYATALMETRTVTPLDGEPFEHTGGLVALVYAASPADDFTIGGAEANMRLIAAAPDLLAALRLYLETYIDTQCIPGAREKSAVGNAARAAIAKAEGAS